MKQSNKIIFDSFLFYNELDLLKVRLSYLGPFIEQFFIVESNCDFAGKPKPYSLEPFLSELPYAHKIKYHQVNINLWHPKWIIKRLRWITRPSKFLWKIQDFQRDAITELIQKEKEHTPDYVLFGDLDEIPDATFLVALLTGKETILEPKTLRQRLFYFRSDISTVAENWFGTLCCPGALFFDRLPHAWRFMRERLPFVEQGGFHFSYFISALEIQKKLNAIADVEKISTYKNYDLELIQESIANAQDIFGRDLGLKRQLGLVPDDLIQLLKKYAPLHV